MGHAVHNTPGNTSPFEIRRVVGHPAAAQIQHVRPRGQHGGVVLREGSDGRVIDVLDLRSMMRVRDVASASLPLLGHCNVFARLTQQTIASITCVCSVICSLQRRCMECCVAFSDPRCSLLVTMYGTTHAHFVLVCWPLLWGLHQMGHSFATFGTCALVRMRMLNSQG